MDSQCVIIDHIYVYMFIDIYIYTYIDIGSTRIVAYNPKLEWLQRPQIKHSFVSLSFSKMNFRGALPLHCERHENLVNEPFLLCLLIGYLSCCFRLSFGAS